MFGEDLFFQDKIYKGRLRMKKFLGALFACFLALVPVLANALEVGDEAPQFEAVSDKGRINLMDYRGKKNVVLAFYFADYTPVWKGELLAFQKDITRFEDLNTQVLGVSYDSIETHKKFTAEYGITFPLISDENKAVRNLYGKGRITFLIDKKGIIQHIQDGVPKNKKFLKKIKELE